MTGLPQRIDRDLPPEEHKTDGGGASDDDHGRQRDRLLQRPGQRPGRQTDEPQHGCQSHRIADCPHTSRVRSVRGSGGELHLGRRLRRRVPRVPLLLQQPRFRGTRHSRGGPSWSRRGPRAGRGRDRRSRRARRARRDRNTAQCARRVSRSPLGRSRPRPRRIARLLAQEARLSRRVARPPRKGGPARGGLGRRAAGLHVRGHERRPRVARAPPHPELARAPVPALMISRRYAIVLPAYLTGLLALDTQVGLHVQLALGALTCGVLVAALWPLSPLVRAQAIGVVLFATVGEVTGSLVWGVYHYRLHNLPLFIPPAHGLVYLSGIALSRSVRARAVVWAAAISAAAWGIAGLTVLPRLDVAGAFGVPLLLVFLWRSRSRATYAGVFLVVAALELYGTSIGTWRWAHDLPGLGIPDGNPPSGVASGYVWFDVMALLVAPWLVYVAGGTLNPKRWTRSSGDLLSSIRRREPIGTITASGASSRASVT